MSESETAATGRREFLQTVVAATVLAAALVDTAEAQPAQRDVFVKHAYQEHTVDLGEVAMNYVVSGRATNPALLLLPAQTESWWGFEKAIALLDKEFQVFAVDLRGQGRSTWTPRRYTLDNMGNDLVRFIALVIKRPVITSGCSSGGVLSAWLSAFAMPGQVRGSHYEDPPLFTSEFNPSSPANERYQDFVKFLGDQWSIGDWKGLVASRAAGPRPDSAPWVAEPSYRASTESQGIRSRVGARLSRGHGRPELPARSHAGASESAGALHAPRPRGRSRHGSALRSDFRPAGHQGAGDRHSGGPTVRVRLTTRSDARDASIRSCPLRAGAGNVGQDTSCVMHQPLNSRPSRGPSGQIRRSLRNTEGGQHGNRNQNDRRRGAGSRR